MNKKLLSKAKNIIKRLSKKYDGFINVGFDNWRGYRFIFDTNETQECNNDCKKCSLFKLLKKENITKNYFGLFLATEEDKEIFGNQKHLNCKTLEQYENCFVNFILKKCKTEKEIKKELLLIKNFKIIFSTKGNSIILEKRFRASVDRKLTMVTGRRRTQPTP